MREPVILLCLLNFAFIGALPHIFFRPGRLTGRWWATAAPLFVMAALLALSLAAGHYPPAGRLTASAGAPAWPVAVLLAAGSIALIGCTIGVHRVPLALWHQSDDRAAALVTHGPYASVRHPFYAAFLLAFIAAVAALPSLLTAVVAVAGWVQLQRTAAREEGRLAAQFGAEYVAYMQRTGRFVPRIYRRAAYSSPRVRT